MKCIPCRQLNGAALSLCLAAVAHSFLLFSFFPYAGYMAMTLLDSNGDSITVDNVGIYAGLLGAIFTLGRFIGFFPWKIVRNRLGGKRAMIISLFLSGLSSIWVGLATTFSGALLARFVQGISNCISGCVKRAAINAQYNRMKQEAITSKRSDESSGQSMETAREGNPQALVLSVMWWGAATGPIIGGLLSDPLFLRYLFGVDSASDLEWYNSSPYLLSNTFTAVLCWLSMICTAIFVEGSPQTAEAWGKQSPVSGSTEEQRPLLTPASSSISTTTPSLWNTFLKLWKINNAFRYHLLAYWSLSFVVGCYDEALPLFLITSKESSGLGLSEGQVGAVLSAAGFIVAIGQHAALERLFDVENGSKNGMYRILSVSAILGSLPVALVPISMLLNNVPKSSNRSDNDHSLLGLTSQSFYFLVALVAFLRGAISLNFSHIGIATGRTLKVVNKDEAARIMTLGNLFVRFVASLIAGAMLTHFMSVSYSINFGSTTFSLHPSWMAWIVIGVVFGLIASVLTVVLARDSGDGMLTHQQREYITSRLNGVSLLKINKDWEEHHDRSKSICFRWITSTFRKDTTKTDAILPTATSTLKSDGDDEPRTRRKRRITWADHIIAPGVDFDKVTFFILGTHKKDKTCVPHVLTPPLMNALQKYLPSRHSANNFWLKFSLLRDGATMHALEAKSGLSRFNIMAIETLKGDVFGCFMTKVRNALEQRHHFLKMKMMRTTASLVEKPVNKTCLTRFCQTLRLCLQPVQCFCPKAMASFEQPVPAR
mmetsp:Transcript_27328/g.74767  ORF Transcript_27328/g.74767 Transcript_27328/m.74767 type:complete len:770 (-) Transcript_27328:1000-3309(-)